MADKVTLERIKGAHPALRKELNEIVEAVSKKLTGKAIMRFAYVLRTFKEQDALFKKVPKVTNAKGGQSFHNYGLAVDIVLLKDTDGNGTYDTASWESNVDFDGDGKADWMEIVEIFKSYGWAWGGDFKSLKDKPHFEKTFGYTWRQLLQLKTEGHVDDEGYVLIKTT